MSSFPPTAWEVRYLRDMDSMEATRHEDREVSMEALMAVRPANGEEGAFRLTLAGADHIKIRISVYEILEHEAFRDAYLDIQLELGTQVNNTINKKHTYYRHKYTLFLQIRLEKNSVCSKWEDMVALVMSQDVDVVTREGDVEGMSERFLEAMETFRKTATKERSGKPQKIQNSTNQTIQRYTYKMHSITFSLQLGISMRWLLGTYGDEQEVYLIAQVLPCSMAVIEANPALKNDHTRGMIAGKFRVQFNSFDGNTAAGIQKTNT